MKFKALLFSWFLVFSGSLLQAQITVDNTLTAEQLVNDYLLGSGVVASNITFNGMPGSEASVQVGLFGGMSNVVDFDTALVMASGDVANIAGGFGGVFTSQTNDPDLVAISGQNINDQAIIEFDFIATSDSIKFNYIFASAEYPGFTCTGFNDAFGFFLSGPGINGPFTNDAINIALIPGTEIPVAINTVNSGMATGGGNPATCAAANPNWIEDSQYFVPNDGQPPADVQYPGLTVTLTAVADVNCGETYHIKLAIGDASDGALDSGVFLEAGSFAAFGAVLVNVAPTIGGDAVINPIYDSVLVAGCSEALIQLIRPNGLPIDSVFVQFGGTAVEGEDYVLGLNDTLFFFPVGVDTLEFSITTLWDLIPGENEEIIISIFYQDGCGELIEASASLPFVDPYSLDSETEDVELFCPTETVSISALGLNGIEDYAYNWGDFGNGPSVTVPVPDDERYYYVGITDVCGFEVKLDSVLVTNSIPDPLQAGIDPFISPTCPNSPVALNATIFDGNPQYTIIWTDQAGNGYAAQNGITVSGINQAVQGYREELGVYLTVVDSCGTVAGDTIAINYPFYEPLTAEFDTLLDNCPKGPIELEARTTGGGTELQYLWTVVRGTSTFAEGSSPDTPVTMINTGGGVNVYELYVTDRCRRMNEDMIVGTTPTGIDFSGDAIYSDSLRVIKLEPLQNVITPNGDNKNEYLVVDGIQAFADARLEVYDRWGKLIFETDNYNAGSPMVRPADAFDADGYEDGTYFIIVNVDSGECVASGTLEVLRSNE